MELRRLEENALLEAQMIAKRRLREQAEPEEKAKQRQELLAKVQQARRRSEQLKRELAAESTELPTEPDAAFEKGQSFSTRSRFPREPNNP